MMIDEIRRSDGSLFAFEVCSAYTTYRGLCRFLSRYPGLELTVRPRPLIGTHPARFMFKGNEFEVCVPFSDYWVGPADAQQTLVETDELLIYARSKLIAPWRRRLIDVLCFDFKSAIIP